MNPRKVYLIIAVIFLIMAVIAATFSITGFTVLEDEQNTNFLGIIFFIAGLASFMLSKLKQKGIK